MNRFLPLLAALSPFMAHAADYPVYFGTRETGPERGFSLAHFNTETGALTKPEFLLAAIGPSFFQIHSDGRHIYSVNTFGSEQKEGMVSAYAIDPRNGKLAFLNSQPSGGINPAYISLDKSGRYALVANYTNGTISVFPIKADGSFGERTAFEQHKGEAVPPATAPVAHAHSIITDPSNRFALCCDLGLDRVYVYKFDEKTGKLSPNDPAFASTKTGSGPRHVLFHPNGKFVYVLCEIANSVIAYSWDSAKGALKELQTTSTLPPNFKDKSTSAEIAIHPNGKLLYSSNRGHNSIAAFTVNPDTGLLTFVETVPTQGRTPRNFSLDPTGQWLMASNNDSASVIVYKVDDATGKLAQTGPLTSLAAPYCERFLVVPPKPGN